jgi:hypothetical protein
MLPNACPKPKPTVKPPKGVNKVNKARKKEDDKRVYGTPARRKWVSLQPCAACGAWGYSQGAHVLGNDGAGRKQGYQTIAPLCTVRPMDGTGGLWPGCHHLFDEKRSEFDANFPDFKPARAAFTTQKAWRKFLNSDVSPEREPSNG